MLTPRELKVALDHRLPRLAADPELLSSVLVVEGLASHCTAELLRGRFAEFGEMVRAFLVRDNIGDRTGVVVFRSAASCSAAAKAEAAPPSYVRTVPATVLGVRNARRCYRQLMNLIGVLYAVSPAVIEEDPFFLERSVLLEGVTSTLGPLDLLIELEEFSPQVAVIVRDTEFRDRVGLVVLKDAEQCHLALEKVPPRRTYCTCILARGASLNRLRILDALDDCAKRQPTADLFRSLTPPEYILADSQMDLHFRCVFVGGPGISDAGGAWGLCCVADEELLLQRGSVTAVIIRRDQDIGVVLCDVASAAEAAYKRVHRLVERRVGMYDSSFFPLPAAGAAAGDHLLPPFIAAAAAEYTGRVLLLRGMDTEACDAAEVARFLEVELGLKKVDAVVVHRGLGAVVVAVHSTADAEALLKVPEKTWFMAFARAVECNLFFPTPPIPQLPDAAGMSDNNSFDLWRAIDPMVFQHVRLKFTDFLDDCSGDNLRGLVRGLGGLAAFSQPRDGLFGSNFTDRAVLLMGPDMYTEPALRQVLSRYGSLDGLVLYNSRKAGKVGMAIFRSWIAAARLLREPDALLGIHCHQAPDVGFVTWILSRIVDYTMFSRPLPHPFGPGDP